MITGVLGVLMGGVLLVGLAGPASTLAASPWWHLTFGAAPASLQAGDEQFVVTAANLGDADVNGGSRPVKITDKLPAGVKATGVEGFVGTVFGGEAPGVSVARGVAIGGGILFGLESSEMTAEEQGGEADLQAGSHPVPVDDGVGVQLERRTGEAARARQGPAV